MPGPVRLLFTLFIIRRAVFSSMQKTAKPWAHLRSVLVYFASLFKIQIIYSYIMQCECIFASGFSALSAPVRAFCTAPPARGRMQRQTPCTVSVSGLRTTFLRFAIKCVLFFSKVSKDGFFSHIFPDRTRSPPFTTLPS